MKARIRLLAALTGILVSAWAQGQSSHQHHHAEQGAGSDARTTIIFPERLRVHTLASMRDHLLAVSEIQEALAKGWFDKASDIAENRLGMGSLKAHGAHESSQYMPKEMQSIGLSMHQNASRFAREAQDASVTGDLKPALEALSRTTQACVACHAAYRLQ